MDFPLESFSFPGQSFRGPEGPLCGFSLLYHLGDFFFHFPMRRYSRFFILLCIRYCASVQRYYEDFYFPVILWGAHYT